MRQGLLALIALVAAAPGLSAQGGMPAGRPERGQMERMVRQRFAIVVRRELALDSATMRKLQQTLQRHDGTRRELMRTENEARHELREAIHGGDSVDQGRISTLLDDLLTVQKRRIELHEQEDREMRTYLTPLQRAKFYGLQEQLRRRVEQMQMQRRAGPVGPHDRPGPPPHWRRPPG